MSTLPARVSTFFADRWKAVRATRQRGASALEFAIIAAVVVVAASVVGAIVYNIVQDKGAALQECADQPLGTECSGGGGPAGG